MADGQVARAALSERTVRAAQWKECGRRSRSRQRRPDEADSANCEVCSETGSVSGIRC